MDTKLLISQDKLLYDAMRLINLNEKGAVFVVNHSDMLVGVLTDGDIRRIVLLGHELSTPLRELIRPNFVYIRKGEDPAEAINKLKTRDRIIPVVDDDMKVVDYLDVRSSIHFPVVTPKLGGSEMNYLIDAFLSTWISSSGKYLEEFEKQFASFIGTRYAVAVSSGTAALHLALLASNISEGDEVIIPDLTFAAVANAVLHARAKPVIVDIEEDSWGIDPREIRKALTSKTKAIIPVHLYGQPCNMNEVMSIARDNQLVVIEDCAEAHGAKFNGQMVGSLGDIGCFSFYGNKIVTTGEGGMCVTDNEDIAERIRLLKNHGMSKNKRYWHEVVGLNYRMTNLHAAIGLAQIQKVEETLRQRKQIESKYRMRLKNIDFIQFQNRALSDREKITWLVSILIKNGLRDKVFQFLNERNLDARKFFYPLSEMALFQDYVFSSEKSRQIAAQGLVLPTIEIGETNIDQVCDFLQEFKANLTVN